MIQPVLTITLDEATDPSQADTLVDMISAILAALNLSAVQVLEWREVDNGQEP